MNTSEVLNKAADLIEKRGWTRGAGWNGQPGTYGLCLEGGIMAALDIKFVAEGDGPPSGFFTCPAYMAVKSHLSLGDDDGRLFWWNDAQPAATNVIEVLRAAAVIEQAKETAEVRESVPA